MCAMEMLTALRHEYDRFTLSEQPDGPQHAGAGSLLNA